jgi:23S rRNA pseudouridine1911/1915/1917 synthase
MVKSNYKIKPGDEIILMSLINPEHTILKEENIPLNIVYEDDYLMVINKPPNMVVHPGVGNFSGTLLNGVAYYLRQQNPQLNEESLPRFGLVHRIDKNTSGLLVVAKTEAAMTHLAKQFEEKTTEREYIALVWGNVKEDSGTIIGNIARHVKDRMQMAVYPNSEHGKHAVTHFKVLERFSYVTLVSCKLETGRTHQIRVHMKYIGHTLFNDSRYGGDMVLKGTTFAKYKQFIDNCFKILPRQALHAKTLGFIHPETKEFMSFDTEIPNDLSTCIEKWRNYSNNSNLETE